MKSTKINPIIDKITRVNSNRITLQINKHGQILISAPHYTTISQMNQLIEDKMDWLIKKRDLILKNQKVKKLFVTGEKFLYLGVERELVIVPKNRNAIAYVDGKFQLSENCIANAEGYFQALYKNLAWNYLAPKTTELAKKYNFEFTNVKVNSARTKWGSCSARNSINYSWHLIMAPPEVVDYVIIHELCHTKIKDHSRRFWDLVSQYTPDYKNHILWLKNNAKLCDI
jgi:predicted metal-dependent hydrolase